MQVIIFFPEDEWDLHIEFKERQNENKLTYNTCIPITM